MLPHWFYNTCLQDKRILFSKPIILDRSYVEVKYETTYLNTSGFALDFSIR